MKQFFYDFSYRIDKFSSVSQEIYEAIENGRDNFIQIIAPLIENFAALTYSSNAPKWSNSSKCWISTPLLHATVKAIEAVEFHHYPSSDNKYLRIVKTLAPITDEHETSYSKLDGLTPLQVAIKRGNSEIVKILACFTNTRSNICKWIYN